MPFDSLKFVAPQQDFRVRLALLPVFKPSVSLLHDGDVGIGHTPVFYAVPIMGPNRIGFVGAPIDFYGGQSYERGSALATGHSWTVYAVDPQDPEGVDRAHAGTVVAGPTSGVNFSWTPTDVGIYRVELQLSNRHTTYNTDGFRFVRVFADDLDGDLLEVTDVRGTGSVDQGGYEVSLTYKPSTTGQTVLPWQRVVVNIDTYFDGSLNTFDSQGIEGIPSVQFNGLVAEGSVQVAYQNRGVSFTLRTPNWALTRIPIRGYQVLETQSFGDPPVPLSVPVEYPLMFADPTAEIPLPDGTTINAVQKAQEAKADFPIHQITGITLTDPLLHALQMHINYMKWWDVLLHQGTENYNLPISLSLSDFWSQIKAIQERTLGEIFCDKKGALHFQPDIRYQREEIWNATVEHQMLFDAGLMKQLSVSESWYKVCQVKLIGIDPAFQPIFVRYPEYADFIGQPYQQTIMLSPGKEKLQEWAKRLYTVLNFPYSLTLNAQGLNRSLELNDVVTVLYGDEQVTL